jgi:transcriptional regulator with XRE-family HTH domain
LHYFFFMDADFKKNLRDELDYQGLTVKELSAQTGIAKGTLDCYLGTRASMPPADAAVKIAQALGVSVEYLVTGEEAKKGLIFQVANRQLRSIMQISQGLGERDRDTLLGLAKILLSQS